MNRIAPALADLAVPIAAIRDDPQNARVHPDRNLEAIEASLRWFGQQKPIVASADGFAIAGNGVLAAARRLGWSTMAAVRSNLKASALRAYAIADNRTGRCGRVMELDGCYADVIRRRWAELAHGEGCDWRELTPPAEESCGRWAEKAR